MPRLAGSDDGSVQLLPSDADAPRAAPRDIPALPQDASLVPSPVRAPLEALREAVQTLLGHRGDPLDRALTLRVAQQKGVLDTTGRFIGGGTTIIQQAPPTGGGAADEPDLTPPPDVTGLRAAAGFTQVIVEWGAATYTQGHGHQKTNLYAVRRDAADTAPAPTAGDAVRVAEATGALTIFALPSEPGMRWYLWAKFETNDGTESLAFAGGINGVQVTTGQDVGGLLKALTGSITDSQLVASLRGRVAAAGRAAAALADDAIAAAVAAHRAERGAQQEIALVRRDTIERIVAGEAAEASAREVLAASVRDNTAALAVESSVRAEQTGHLGAQWNVRMVLDSGGRTVAGGFGLAGSSSATAGSTIGFGVLANQFFVGAPDDGSGTPGAFPFVIQTTDVMVNGVLVEKGTYVDGLKVINLQAMMARLGVAWIDDAKIASVSAAKLTVGDGTVGGNLKSANFVGGSAGWLLRPDGYAELSNAVIRGSTYTGSIFSGSGSIGGFTIGLADIRSSGYVPGTSGIRLNADGSAEFYNVVARGDIQATSLNAATGTFRGALNAATGTFAGALQAATGTFSGTLTAQAVNAVQTINIAGDAVSHHSLSVFEYLDSTEMRPVLPVTMNQVGQITVMSWFTPFGHFDGDEEVVSVVYSGMAGTTPGLSYTLQGGHGSRSYGQSALATQITTVTATLYNTGTLVFEPYALLTNVGHTDGYRGGRFTCLVIRKYR